MKTIYKIYKVVHSLSLFTPTTCQWYKIRKHLFQCIADTILSLIYLLFLSIFFRAVCLSVVRISLTVECTKWNILTEPGALGKTYKINAYLALTFPITVWWQVLWTYLPRIKCEYKRRYPTILYEIYHFLDYLCYLIRVFSISY